MSTNNSIKDLVLQHLQPLKHSSSGWHTRNCPFCGYRGHSHDTRYRFGVFVESDGSMTFNCFNCAIKAKWKAGTPFTKTFTWCMKTIGISASDINKFNMTLRSNTELEEESVEDKISLTSFWKQKDKDENLKDMQTLLLNNCEDEDFLKCAEYIVNRGFYDLSKFSWTPNDKHRIIIPLVYNSKYVGLESRYYSDVIPEKVYKYFSNKPRGFLYNLDAQQKYNRKYIIVVESALDAIHVDGVAILGRNVTNEQFDIINKFNKKVIFVPDFDKSAMENIDRMIDNGWSISTPPWENGIKDVGEAVLKYGRILTLESILQNSHENKVKVKMEIRRKRSG